MHPQIETRFNTGFTLVEVLIALSLSVLLAGLLFSSLHTYALSATAGQKHLATKQISESVYQFISDQLRQVVPLVLRTDRERNVLFHGNDRELIYIGHIPHHRSAGGLHRNSLEIDGLPPHQSLLFNYERLNVDAEFDLTTFVEAAEGTEKTLIDDVRSIEFAYFGAEHDGDEPGWSAEWTIKDRLPQLVRVRFDYDNRKLPDEITIPLHANLTSKRVALGIGNSTPGSINELLRQLAPTSNRDGKGPREQMPK
jgi:prepilin-type N-terminal cleavage/methylation domain-containing protein